MLGVDAHQGWLVSIVDHLPAWILERASAFGAACFKLSSWNFKPRTTSSSHSKVMTSAELKRVLKLPELYIISGASAICLKRES
ncbi:hypothetical protein D1BOALGB6SA_8181 [Olavius sp. associated proteobacterium Delta 1]|nr:hypothetical protein D1BOALGB6SA_8181 [Olavius sp. associated proteobacterium Delta 1]